MISCSSDEPRDYVQYNLEDNLPVLDHQSFSCVYYLARSRFRERCRISRRPQLENYITEVLERFAVDCVFIQSRVPQS